MGDSCHGQQGRHPIHACQSSCYLIAKHALLAGEAFKSPSNAVHPGPMFAHDPQVWYQACALPVAQQDLQEHFRLAVSAASLVSGAHQHIMHGCSQHFDRVQVIRSRWHKQEILDLSRPGNAALASVSAVQSS